MFLAANTLGVHGALPVVPALIQTPDLAFAEPLRLFFDRWARDHGIDDVQLSIVRAEPASDSLLNDARTGLARFAGAFVPSWLIPDLIRDHFIDDADPPPAPLPPAVAQLRAFGGRWVASDFDHDCDLLYSRIDLLEQHGLSPAETWDALEQQSSLLFDQIGGGIALPQTHAQQVVDHFASMAAGFAISDTDSSHFWFDPETMRPAIGSEAHLQALERWRALARTTPAPARAGSTSDLWQSFLDGTTAYLLASARFLPYALEREIDPAAIGISELPGTRASDGTVYRVGNSTGANWGGVVLRTASEDASSAIRAFFGSLAEPEIQAALWPDRSSGIIPATVDATELASLPASNWPQPTTTAWLDAIHRTLHNPVQLPALRIAETRRYLQALEECIVPLLASAEKSAGEALAEAVERWVEIDSAIGLETQQQLLRQSLMPPPVSG